MYKLYTKPSKKSTSCLKIAKASFLKNHRKGFSLMQNRFMDPRPVLPKPAVHSKTIAPTAPTPILVMKITKHGPPRSQWPDDDKYKKEFVDAYYRCLTKSMKENGKYRDCELPEGADLTRAALSKKAERLLENSPLYKSKSDPILRGQLNKLVKEIFSPESSYTHKEFLAVILRGLQRGEEFAMKVVKSNPMPDYIDKKLRIVLEAFYNWVVNRQRYQADHDRKDLPSAEEILHSFVEEIIVDCKASVLGAEIDAISPKTIITFVRLDLCFSSLKPTSNINENQIIFERLTDFFMHFY